MTQQQITLSPTPPFDFRHTLEFLRGFKADGLHKEIRGNTLTQAFRVLGENVLVRLEPTGTATRPELTCTLFANVKLSQELIDATRDRLCFYLSLEDNLRPFYSIAEKDDAFRPIIEKLYGYHQVKFATPFTAACWALVTQRTPNPFAYKTMQRLSESLGDKLEHEGICYTIFPEPQAFLFDATDEILEATNNTRKTERLLDVASAFATVDEHFLRSAPYEEVAKWLKFIKGFGAWSVDYLMLRALGRSERTPWTDMWLLGAISKVYTGGLTISRGDARRLAETYGWYQGYWVHYLRVAY